MSQHQFTTTRNERVEAAVAAVRKGRGVLVVDDEDRENEGDIIFSAASITHEQMALLIRECSGIVCLCLPEDKVRQLDLPQMVANNTCCLLYTSSWSASRKNRRAKSPPPPSVFPWRP